MFQAEEMGAEGHGKRERRQLEEPHVGLGQLR